MTTDIVWLCRVLKVTRFSKKCAKAIADLDSRVALFRQDPSADNVHDVRTTTRRVEAALDLLPKKLQTKTKSQEISVRLQKVIQINVAT